MKPSSFMLYATVLVSSLLSVGLGQGFFSGSTAPVYQSYGGAQSFSGALYGGRRGTGGISLIAALIGSALGWAVGNALATRHCRKCSEENNNTEADCTGDEGCEVKEQADNDNVCTCGRNISDIFKGF